MSGEDEHKVGFKRPPQHTQFKPGKSGNPKGRPKGAKNSATLWAQELSSLVAVTEDGQRRSLPKRQLVVKKAVNKAINGDHHAMRIVMEMEARLEARQDEGALPGFSLEEADRVTMESIFERIVDVIEARKSGLTLQPEAEEDDHAKQP